MSFLYFVYSFAGKRTRIKQFSSISTYLTLVDWFTFIVIVGSAGENLRSSGTNFSQIFVDCLYEENQYPTLQNSPKRGGKSSSRNGCGYCHYFAGTVSSLSQVNFMLNALSSSVNNSYLMANLYISEIFKVGFFSHCTIRTPRSCEPNKLQRVMGS